MQQLNSLTQSSAQLVWDISQLSSQGTDSSIVISVGCATAFATLMLPNDPAVKISISKNEIAVLNFIAFLSIYSPP